MTIADQDLPIIDYDRQTAQGIATKLERFSQRELQIIGAYETKRKNRATITDRIAKLTAEEPWSGYDEQRVREITARLAGRDAETTSRVRSYELAHKDRAGVLDATVRHTVS
ncbi:MAG: hypothetical protein M3071_05860 [Actinomycetota bacterium]|nr:hypothetical protein [Actinomycetota bacterium]